MKNNRKVDLLSHKSLIFINFIYRNINWLIFIIRINFSKDLLKYEKKALDLFKKGEFFVYDFKDMNDYWVGYFELDDINYFNF